MGFEYELGEDVTSVYVDDAMLMTSWITSSNTTDLLDDCPMPQPCSSATESVTCFMRHIVLPSFYALITLVGIVGNGMVIYVILSKQKMRTVTNLLLLNLAVADLLFVLICPPFTAVVHAMNNWPLGSVLCKLFHYLLNVTVYVTIYTLVIICVIRYLTIVHGAATSRFRTRNNIIIIAVAIWVVMLLCNAPIISRYDTTPIESTANVYVCDLLDSGSSDARVIFGTLFIAGYLLPLATIIVLSVLIVRYIAHHRQPSVDKGRSASRKRQASRLIVLVVAIFALFWLPVHIYILGYYFQAFCDHPAIALLTQSLAYFNSCVNPIIYNSTSKDFRDCFQEVATCGRRRADVFGEATIATRFSIDAAAHGSSRERQPIIGRGSSKRMGSSRYVPVPV